MPTRSPGPPLSRAPGPRGSLSSQRLELEHYR